jgi:hypothetical protein
MLFSIQFHKAYRGHFYTAFFLLAVGSIIHFALKRCKMIFADEKKNKTSRPHTEANLREHNIEL